MDKTKKPGKRFVLTLNAGFSARVVPASSQNDLASSSMNWSFSRQYILVKTIGLGRIFYLATFPHLTN